MPFGKVAHMYGQYGFIGNAYDLMQVYSLEALDVLVEIVFDFVRGRRRSRIYVRDLVKTCN